MDLTVEGKVFIKGTFENCCLGIENGKIVEVKKILKSDEHINFGNHLILPAGVDLHVHFREPGMTYKEDFYTGSLAAVFGGISCVFDMPNTKPQTTSITTFNDKLADVDKKALVDFGLYAGVSDNNINQLKALADICNGFKIYLGHSTNSLDIDSTILKQVFKQLVDVDKLILFHAEDKECLKRHSKVETSLSAHLQSRPSECEETAIKNILNMAQNQKVMAHVCHVSSCEAMELLKNRPRNVSIGVTPHHSLLNIEKDVFSPTYYKVNPPIRTSFDMEILFNAVKTGMVDILESDHAPHTSDEKNTDFNDAPSGVPGVETMYPLFLYMVKKEMLSYSRLVSLLCSRPAELIGISKGRLEPSYDADFIVVDIKKDTRIKSENLHSRCGWTPFEDWPGVFPETVFIRGEKLIEDNEIQVKPGFGRLIGV